MLKKLQKKKNEGLASFKNLPKSEKIYSHSSVFKDVKVGMRNIILEDDEIKNITVYDTSGLYSDPNYSHIYEEGLKKIRGNWLQNRKGIIKSSKTDLKYI